jgi:hypothetical protein
MNAPEQTALFRFTSIYNIISESTDDNLTLATMNNFIISVIQLYLSNDDDNNKKVHAQTHFMELLKEAVNFYNDVIVNNNIKMYGYNPRSAGDAYLARSEAEDELSEHFDTKHISKITKNNFCENLYAWIHHNKEPLSRTTSHQNNASTEEFSIAIFLLLKTVERSST